MDTNCFSFISLHTCGGFEVESRGSRGTITDLFWWIRSHFDSWCSLLCIFVGAGFLIKTSHLCVGGVRMLLMPPQQHLSLNTHLVLLQITSGSSVT